MNFPHFLELLFVLPQAKKAFRPLPSVRLSEKAFKLSKRRGSSLFAALPLTFCPNLHPWRMYSLLVLYRMYASTYVRTNMLLLYGAYFPQGGAPLVGQKTVCASIPRRRHQSCFSGRRNADRPAHLLSHSFIHSYAPNSPSTNSACQTCRYREHIERSRHPIALLHCDYGDFKHGEQLHDRPGGDLALGGMYIRSRTAGRV